MLCLKAYPIKFGQFYKNSIFGNSMDPPPINQSGSVTPLVLVVVMLALVVLVVVVLVVVVLVLVVLVLVLVVLVLVVV